MSSVWSGSTICVCPRQSPVSSWTLSLSAVFAQKRFSYIFWHYARHKSLIKLKFNVMQMATLGISEVAPPDGFISDLICSPGLHSRARDVACLGLCYGLPYVLAWACNLFLISFLNVSGLLFFGFFFFFFGVFIFFVVCLYSLGLCRRDSIKFDCQFLMSTVYDVYKSR